MSLNIFRLILVFLLALPNLSSMAETQAKQAKPALAKPASLFGSRNQKIFALLYE
jgi:hypothetical protein